MQQSLAASLARYSERAMILSEMEAGHLSCTRIGGPLLFGRLWKRLGIADVLADLFAAAASTSRSSGRSSLSVRSKIGGKGHHRP